MKHIKSIILTMLTVLLTLSASAQTIVGILTLEDLETVGLTNEKRDFSGGTVLLDNEAGILRMAYDDQWGTLSGYGTNSYREVKVGDSGMVTIGRAVAGNTNPSFVSYQRGVMTAGAVFELTAHKTGWMTVFLRMSAHKQYVVFEGSEKGIPYTLGMAKTGYKINYSLPMQTSGPNAGGIDFDAPGASRYFRPAQIQSTNADGVPLWTDAEGNVVATELRPEDGHPVYEDIVPMEEAPQFPYIVADMEEDTSPVAYTGFLTFRVTAGKTYYFSALGSKVPCSGFVFTESANEPTVTFLATEELPEETFTSKIEGVQLAAGDNFEYEGIWYTVIDPEANTCRTKEGRYDDENSASVAGNNCQGNIVIPERVSDGYDYYTVTEIGRYSFSGCSRLTAVEIPGSVTSIGDYAFSECINLSSVDIPDAVASVGSSAFRACARLTSVTLPASLTSLAEMTFALCTSLPSIDLPETITEIGDMAFVGCSSLTSIEIPNSVSTIGIQAFGNCTALRSIDLPEGLTSISDALLMGCSALASIDLPENVAAIGRSSFEGCTGLSAIDIPESVVSIGQRAVRDCNGLNSLNIPQSLTSIAPQTFYGCAGLSTIDIPESVTSVGEGAFMECSGLTSVTIPRSVTSIGGRAFYECAKILSVTYTAASPVSANDDIFDELVYQEATLEMPHAVLADIRSTAPWNKFGHIKASDGSIGFVSAGDDFEYEGIWYTVIDPEAKTVKTKEAVMSYIPDFAVEGELNIPASVSHEGEEYSVVEIGNQSFRETRVTSVTIPNSVVRIGYAAFRYCNNLTTVTLPASLTEFDDEVFYGCGNITEVDYLATNPVLASDNEFEWEVYYYAILNAPNATLADIHATNPWRNFRYINAADGSAAPVLDEGTDFEYNGIWYTVVDSYEQTCKTKAGGMNGETIVSGNYAVGSLVIPAQASDGINLYTVIGVGHESFYNNTEITSVQLPETVTYVGDSSFSGCTGLTSFDFPSSLTELGAYAFQNCTGFTAMDIPNTVTSIGAGLLANCSNLASVNLPTSITVIELNTFASCSRLSSIVIPNSVTSIGTGAFIRCTGLSSVSIPNSVESIGISAFAYCSRLISISIPNSVSSIGISAFTGCSGLTSIDMPASVTAIGANAFADCSGLTIVHIPGNLTLLGSGAFAGCHDIITVTYDASSPLTADADVFSDVVYGNATLNTPNATVSAIRSTTPWKLFGHAIASDGSVGFVADGDEFEYEGIWYTVIDSDARTCKTKDNGNVAAGDIIIPATASDGNEEYSVIEIGSDSFRGSENLRSVSLPVTINSIGDHAFADCERLTSFVWTRHSRLSGRVVEEISNPNLLLYVDSVRFAPENMTVNVVADGVCESLELTPEYPFTPLNPFTALQSRMVKEFRQETPIGGTAGWETIVLPFDATQVYAENIRSILTPFSLVTDIYAQRPYWLYEADPRGEWKHAFGITAGVPYLISTPNNPEYPEYYNVNGPVVFSNDNPQRITPETTAPYAVTWASGREFRSLWLPLEATEAASSMGLNAGVYGLTDDEGERLAPGSAFHTGIVPKPLEAYVTRLGAERAMRIMGNQSAVIPVLTDSGLDICVEDGAIHALSATDRTIHVITPEGVIVRVVALKAGVTSRIDGLTDGIYIVAGRKLILR